MNERAIEIGNIRNKDMCIFVKSKVKLFIFASRYVHKRKHIGERKCRGDIRRDTKRTRFFTYLFKKEKKRETTLS